MSTQLVHDISVIGIENTWDALALANDEKRTTVVIVFCSEPKLSGVTCDCV
jgi:hypothetical protein